MITARRRRPLEIWPAFVDATASLLLVVVFALLIATFGHFVLSTELTDRNEALVQLNEQIKQLGEVLSLKNKEAMGLERLLQQSEVKLSTANTEIATLGSTLQQRDTLLAQRETALTEKSQQLNEKITLLEKLNTDIAALSALKASLKLELEQGIAENEDVRARLQSKTELNVMAQAQIELLNQQLAELRTQLSAIAVTLEIAEQHSRDKDVLIDELGTKLNLALVSKAQALQRYRSEFFGRLREALSNYPDIQIVGDRFVLPSSLLFKTASDKLGPEGQKQIKQLAKTLNEVSQIIPQDIDWVLRIDGHTDKRPIKDTSGFASNWELSTGRAISIIHALVKLGIPANRMAATGFAEHHPIDPGETSEAYARNRRIEIKLTSR